jgi:hypothetical protein
MKSLLVATLPALTATSAFAGGPKIINHSGVPIDELYASQPGKKAWGANLLDGAKEGSLEDGMEYVVAGLSDGTYDLRVEAPDEGISCVMPTVSVKSGTAMLTPEIAKGCK